MRSAGCRRFETAARYGTATGVATGTATATATGVTTATGVGTGTGTGTGTATRAEATVDGVAAVRLTVGGPFDTLAIVTPSLMR